MISKYEKLFDPDLLRITEADLRFACMFSPFLDKDPRFQIGKIWPLAHHQLRRTGAVNMFASGVSDSSIQVQLQHLNVIQTAYYGRNFTRLRLSQETDAAVREAKYEVIACELMRLSSDRYVSPRGATAKTEIVNLVSKGDYRKLIKSARLGHVSFRRTRLGACTQVAPCDYGGIESIARCAGEGGTKGCKDAVFDRELEGVVRRQLKQLEQASLLEITGSPRQLALLREIGGLRNYLEIIQ
ncbi:hypothetical protein [Bordetella genomosp. 12]|uniref:hypothetical protein n=1 Tax=Bordetella genomosp. 12 TaxID=463035 RepID=UPI001178A46B|nr:hypothetical protein [Bordetella genomosp. 12]